MLIIAFNNNNALFQMNNIFATSLTYDPQLQTLSKLSMTEKSDNYLQSV